MNYYERHLGDYARDAGHLSMLEHGAYTLLLDRYYTTEQGIPQDQAHRVCRARSKEERAAVDAVLAEFFVLQDGAWTNGRAEREVAKMQTKVEAARTNGKRGGRPNKNPQGTQEKPSGLLLGSVLVTQEKAHQSPDTSNQIQGAGNGGGAETPARVHEADAGPNSRTAGQPGPGGPPSAAAQAVAAVVAAGVVGSVSFAEVQRLLDAGVTQQELAATGADLVARGKGRWPLLLRTVEGRRADAAAHDAIAAAGGAWQDTRAGVEAKGEALGLGRWDQAAFDASLTAAEQAQRSYRAYEARVLQAAGVARAAA